MNKTVKYIISVAFGLALLFAASLSASADNTCCAVSPSGGGQKVYFTDKKLYYEQNRTEPYKSSKDWVAKYNPDTNTLTLRGYHGGTITFDQHPEGLPPRIELIYSNTITVTEPNQNGYYSGIYTKARTDSLTIDRSDDATGSVAMYINIEPETVADKGALVAMFTPHIKEIFTYVDVCITVDNPEKNRELFQVGIYQTVGKVYKMSNGEEVPYNPLLHVLGDSEFIIYMYTAYPKKIVGFSNYAYNGIVHANTSNKIIIDSSDVYGVPAVKGLVVDKARDISIISKMNYAVPPGKFYTPLDESKYAYRQVYSRVDSSYSARFRNGKSYELTVDYGKNDYGSRAVTKARYIAGEEVQLDPVYDHRADGVLFSTWDCESGIGYFKMPDDPYTKCSTLKMPTFDTTLTAIYSAPVTAVIDGVYSNRGTVTINDNGKNTAAVSKGEEFTVTVLPGTGFTARDFDKSFITSGKATFVKRDGETFTFTKDDNDPVTMSIPLQYIDYKITYHLPPKSFIFTATGSYKDVPENFTFYNYGVHRRLPANSDVKCNETGYRLEGWYRKYDRSTGVYSDGPYQAVPNDVSGDIQFFAKWTEDLGAAYPIRHYATVESPKDGGYTISDLSETNAGCKNIGFELCPSAGYEIDNTVIPYISYMRKNGGSVKIMPTKLGKGRYSFDMPEDVRKSVTIYANDINDERSAFKLSTYTITYNLNGGEKSNDFDSCMPQTYTVEDDLNLTPRSNTIRRRGYTFKHWCFDAECTTDPVYYIKRGNIHKNVTFYANWVPTKYTVTVNTDSGRGNVSDYGSVIQSHTNAYADNEVTVWAEPKEGCMVRLLYVFGKDSSQRIYPSEGENHSYTFTMPDENVEVNVYFSPYCTVTASKSPLYTIEPIYDPQKLDYSAEKMPKGHTYKFYLRLAPGSYKTENFAITANGVPVSYKEEGGFYYTKISEDTAIEVTGIESGKIDVTASVSENTLTANAEIYSGLDMYGKIGICAVYDESGKLLQMQTDDLNADSGTTVKTHTFVMTGINAEKLTVKYFVWNSLGTLSPFLPNGEYVFIRE